ncbi:MAG: hypothetical protein U9R74_03165, partial [Pseudomonadota bacterium]|nr:hypothetical protein [Pseudomonadota bacterium]
MTYQITPDFRSSSRRDNRRIVERWNGCRNTGDRRKDQQDGMSIDRNRLSIEKLFDSNIRLFENRL